MAMQARDKDLGVVRAEKQNLHVAVKDLELKVKAARREAETSSAALRTAQRAKKWASPQCCYFHHAALSDKAFTQPRL